MGSSGHCFHETQPDHDELDRYDGEGTVTTVLRTVSIEDIVLALAPAAGPAVARERVTAVLAALDLPPYGRLPRDDAARVLEDVQRGGGAMALAASQALRRLDTGGRLSGQIVAVVPPTEGERTVTRMELVEFLTPAVGREAAEAAVARAAERLGFKDKAPARQALAVLEAIAEEPGPAAATAMFAKARLRLR